MEWVPDRGWLTKVAVDGTAAQLGFDLAIDASGAGRPSAVDAGFTMPGAVVPAAPIDLSRLFLALGFVGIGLVGIGLIARARPSAGRPIGW
jgi:hypothetical protein